MGKILERIRRLTDYYTPPADACVNHKVTFLKLHEIDNDLVQHIHLENDILFPKAVAMEKELLHRD
jgi:regulator of cell morphogenesis and NO signaling